MIRLVRGVFRVLARREPTRRRNPIPSITREEVAEIKQFFPRDKFFVFGHARSGTTLLVRLLRLHPEVHCNYQAHFFTRRPLLTSLVDSSQVEEWLKRKSNRWNHGRDLSPLVLRAAAEIIMEREAAAVGKRIVGDKSPSSTIHGQSVRDLHNLFPDARLVYLVRDGRDVLVSERFRNFVEESRFLNGHDRRILRDLRTTPGAFGSDGRSIFTEEVIERVGKGWASNVSEIDAEGKRLFGRHYYALRYEDLLESPLDELTRLWKFLGAKKASRTIHNALIAELKSNPDEEWQHRRSGDLAALVPKGMTGNWKRLFTARDKMVFKQVAGGILTSWRYEKSLNW